MEKTNPENVLKFCPKCGSRRFVPKGDRSFQCDDCGFHFYINSASAVAALIINENDELLLTRRGIEPGKGMLDLPGGFVNPGERAEDAVVREIKEELNLEVTDYQFLASYPNEYIFSGYKVYTTDIGFLCKVRTIEAISAKDDVSGYEFVKRGSIDYSDICGASIRLLVRYYFDHGKSLE